MPRQTQQNSELASAELNVARAESNISQSILKHTNNNRLLIVVAIALIINLVLTISLAGAFVTLNDNVSMADEVQSMSSMLEKQSNSPMEDAQIIIEDGGTVQSVYTQ